MCMQSITTIDKITMIITNRVNYSLVPRLLPMPKKPYKRTRRGIKRIKRLGKSMKAHPGVVQNLP